VNAPTVGGEAHLPFGRIKATGRGPREMGPDAWKFYAESKTVYLHHGARSRSTKRDISGASARSPTGTRLEDRPCFLALLTACASDGPRDDGSTSAGPFARIVNDSSATLVLVGPDEWLGDDDDGWDLDCDADVAIGLDRDPW
jgi:hypothetical protein